MNSIRCDWLFPDGDDIQTTQRIVTAKGGLVSIWRVLGHRYPPEINELGEWIRSSVIDFTTEMHMTWLQYPDGIVEPTSEAIVALPELLYAADHNRSLAMSQGAAWMTLATAHAGGAQANVRRERHEAIVRRLTAPKWLALRRLNGQDSLNLAAGLSGLRPSAIDAWPDGSTGVAGWFDIGREVGAIQLGRYWLASVCAVGGPTNHRTWADFHSIDAPCWLHFRIAGNAHKRLSFRAKATHTFRRAGNERRAEAFDALAEYPEGTVPCVSIVGLAAGTTPFKAKAAAAALAQQLESWLGVRVSLQASAIDVLSLCVPGFVSTRGGLRPNAWAATGEQAGGILPLGQPASPWTGYDLSKIQNWVPANIQAINPNHNQEPTVMVTAPAGGRAQPYPFDLFGAQPTPISVIAGASGSGKSLAMARIIQDFTTRYPDSPVRILDVGRSAEPLADLWRSVGVSVATPDLQVAPDINPMAPPFPLLAGGPVHAAAVKAIIKLLIEDLDKRKQGVLDRALKLVWEEAASGILQGRKKPYEELERHMARKEWALARAAHAKAVPTLEDLTDKLSSPAIKGIGGPAVKAAESLVGDLLQSMENADNLLRSPPPEWHGALRVIAELGGQAISDDPQTALRYALGVWMLSGDLIPDDWQLDSAPGPASKAWASERCARIRSQPKIIVCDEMHRLADDPQVQLWLARLAREGRKARLGLMLASQSTRDFSELIVQQSSVRMLFGVDANGPGRFGVHPETIRPGVGNLALACGMGDGHYYQSRLRIAVTPEHLWALASGVGERALIQAMIERHGGRTKAVRELAQRLPEGRIPADAPPLKELIRAWDAG